MLDELFELELEFELDDEEEDEEEDDLLPPPSLLLLLLPPPLSSLSDGLESLWLSDLLDDCDVCDWLLEPDGFDADRTLASGATTIASAAIMATTRWPQRR